MRVREMHPLCCVSLESPCVGARSPLPGRDFPPPDPGGNAGSDGGGGGVAGVLYKWTNYGRGWRSRWFLLRNGVLSYSKIRRPDNLALVSPAEDVRVIGDGSCARLLRLDSSGSRRRCHRSGGNGGGIVHLKISWFRESKSDERRFYIFTATKTLHLRTDSRSDRSAWIEALVSSRALFLLRPLGRDVMPNEIRVSAERLKARLVEEGAGEALVKDCEQIMLSEFSQLQGRLTNLSHERSSLLHALRQQIEEANIEAEASGIHGSDYQLTKHDFSDVIHGKYSECSTTASSDDIEKQEIDEASDEQEPCFFDTKEHFSESIVSCRSVIVSDNEYKPLKPDNEYEEARKMHVVTGIYPYVERRKKLPDPVEKEKGASLWSMIKDNIGKDLARVCLPVYFNEPISSLQKCFEDLEYSYLLDQAYEHGKAGNSLLRALKVAAFAVSAYASSEGRHCKPFNPLLGETYEADYPDKGLRFFSEKVSHHPTLIACHCEGKGWKFWADSNIRSKFWGRSIQLDPDGVLTVEFDDGEIFRWSKVTTTIYNLILGKVYCDHHGIMHLRGNRQYSCKLKFKEQSLIERNPHQVQGFVEDVAGNKVASLFGKWDDSMYYVNGNGIGKSRDPSADASLLWKSDKPTPNLTRYNLTSFAITLNELTPGLQEKLPRTDSRLRPDQRHLENGEYAKANEEKLRLERRQRMSRNLQDNGWRPRWFRQRYEDGPFEYVGGYWEAREQGKWDECPDIFGEFNESMLLTV